MEALSKRCVIESYEDDRRPMPVGFSVDEPLDVPSSLAARRQAASDLPGQFELPPLCLLPLGQTGLTFDQMYYLDQQEPHPAISSKMQLHTQWPSDIKTWGQIKQWLLKNPNSTWPISQVEEAQKDQWDWSLQQQPHTQHPQLQDDHQASPQGAPGSLKSSEDPQSHLRNQHPYHASRVLPPLIQYSYPWQSSYCVHSPQFYVPTDVSNQNSVSRSQAAEMATIVSLPYDRETHAQPLAHIAHSLGATNAVRFPTQEEKQSGRSERYSPACSPQKRSRSWSVPRRPNKQLAEERPVVKNECDHGASSGTSRHSRESNQERSYDCRREVFPDWRSGSFNQNESFNLDFDTPEPANAVEYTLTLIRWSLCTDEG